MSQESQREPATGPGHFLNELRETFARRANHVAVIYKDLTLTYAALDFRARCFGGLLRHLGVKPGDRVAIATAKKSSFLVAHLGTLYSGGIALPLNPRYTADELRFFLEDSAARVVVAGDDLRSLIDSFWSDLPELLALLHDDEDWNAAHAVGHLARAKSRRPLPDALQLGHDRPAQGRRAHARQPRLEPAGPARLLAIHARRRAGQRPAAVPHPRALVRDAPEPA